MNNLNKEYKQYVEYYFWIKNPCKKEVDRKQLTVLSWKLNK